LKALGNFFLAIFLVGFITLISFPTMLIFTIAISIINFNGSFINLLIRIIVFPFAVILLSFFQVVWMGIVLSVIDTLNKERSFAEAIIHYQTEWNTEVNNFFKKSTKKSKSIYDKKLF
ncbi:hypothetical protein LCGC14_1163200, partial [marine sediment metagenome]